MRMDLPALLESGQVTVTATYETVHPYAVCFAFPEGDVLVEWAVSRDLLADALTAGHAGVGDVRVTARGDLVVLELSSLDGKGWALFRRDDVAALVALTHQAVRPGTESQFLDWSDISGFPGVAP